MDKNKFALGALLGAAAGIVAGVLAAPKSGHETREDLKKRALELKEDAAKRAEQVSGAVADSNLQERLGSASEKAKQAASDIKESIRKRS